MRLDEQTLADLDIFEAEGGAPGLFSLLDRTRTYGGRSRLAERFRTPSSSAGEIREIQAGLRFLSCSPALSTDNAAMIAFTAWHSLRQGASSSFEEDIDPNLPLVTSDGDAERASA